ncbi:alpha/beta hydrolase [Bacillus sp. AFS040349]|uniref:alpha/beta hydrolase n=1 Tax=Bacillus sp. AFS040349 TaxID=2033502 RepID=UPI000BFCD461|nr:alpha/beta hydrolase-fold protein [Bacillus sp. AFS040349]PGT76567.1 enterobactin esterase [Bacillus sp. AFS040349]
MTEENYLMSESEFKLPGAKQYQFVSKKKRVYQIFVSIPNEEPPTEGFPVMYLLDGNSIFSTVVEAVRIQSRKPERTGVVPAIVVGVGYPVDVPFSHERFYDYTMGEPEVQIPSTNTSSWPEHGGAEDFSTFLEKELKPALEKNLAINKHNQTLFGHSLGGLFVLYALFTRSTSFQTYIAGSPSIHWNQKIILEAEKKFKDNAEAKNIDANLLIGIGELERWHHTNVGELAKEMAERLTIHTNITVKFIQFEDEGHVSVLPALISKSLRFASQKSPVR